MEKKDVKRVPLGNDFVANVRLSKQGETIVVSNASKVVYSEHRPLDLSGVINLCVVVMNDFDREVVKVPSSVSDAPNGVIRVELPREVQKHGLYYAQIDFDIPDETLEDKLLHRHLVVPICEVVRDSDEISNQVAEVSAEVYTLTKGDKGEKGEKGEDGRDGQDGKDGVAPSAEEVATTLKADSGFLESVKGEKGDKGDPSEGTSEPDYTKMSIEELKSIPFQVGVVHPFWKALMDEAEELIQGFIPFYKPDWDPWSPVSPTEFIEGSYIDFLLLLQRIVNGRLMEAELLLHPSALDEEPLCLIKDLNAISERGELVIDGKYLSDANFKMSNNTTDEELRYKSIKKTDKAFQFVICVNRYINDMYNEFYALLRGVQDLGFIRAFGDRIDEDFNWLDKNTYTTQMYSKALMAKIKALVNQSKER